MAWFQPKHFLKSTEYPNAKNWAIQFRPDPGDPDTETTGKVALEFAWKAYEELGHRRERIEDKASELLRLSVAMVVLAVAAIKAFLQPGTFPGMTFYLACLCFVIAMLLSLVVRVSIFTAALPTIRSVCHSLPKTQDKNFWLAKTIYTVCVTLKYPLDRAGVLVNWSIAILSLGVFTLAVNVLINTI